MSRTYRRAKVKDSYMLNDYGILRRWEGYGLYRVIDRKSDEGRKIIRLFHSDRGHSWMDYRGPSWFIREFTQVPYRARARTEIVKWTRNPDYEICLESKPHRDYWL